MKKKSAGNLTGMQYGNGVTNGYGYDSLNRLTNLIWKAGKSPLLDYTRGIDLSGTLDGLPHERGPESCSHIAEAESSEVQSMLSAQSLTGERGVGGLLARSVKPFS